MSVADLAGDIATMRVADVLRWLAREHATGTLVVHNSGIEKQIFFRNGEIIAVGSNNPREYLGHFLVSHGYIDEAQLTAAMARQERDRALLGKILVDDGTISTADLDYMLQLKLRESLFDLFTWREGEFCFVDGQLPVYDMVPLSVGVTGFVLEAMQRLDEWGEIKAVISSPDAVPVAVAETLEDPELSEQERAVVAAVNDDRSIGEIATLTNSTEYFVAAVVHRLVDAHKIKVVRPRQLRHAEVVPETDPPTLMAQAWKHFKDGNYEGALRLGRAASTLDVASAGLRRDISSLEVALRETLEAEGVKLSRVPKLLAQAAELKALAQTPEEEFVLGHIDNRSTVAEVLKLTPIAMVDAMLVLFRLLKAGRIALERPEQPKAPQAT
jgi:hypothetical protein